MRFPPYMGGCIVTCKPQHRKADVSSLHGRVYRWLTGTTPTPPSFLPTWEGVSDLSIHHLQPVLFPPYTGGCIVYFALFSRIIVVFSLYGRVYRRRSVSGLTFKCFLPVREGVSWLIRAKLKTA